MKKKTKATIRSLQAQVADLQGEVATLKSPPRTDDRAEEVREWNRRIGNRLTNALAGLGPTEGFRATYDAIAGSQSRADQSS